MTNPEQRPEPGNETAPPRTPGEPTYDEIALKAYFIALDRARKGKPNNPLEDWLQAEREATDFGTSA